MLLAKKNNSFCTWAFLVKLEKWLKFTKPVGKMMNYFTYKFSGSHTHTRCRRCKFYSVPVPAGAGILCRNSPHPTEQHSWAARGRQSDNHRVVPFDSLFKQCAQQSCVSRRVWGNSRFVIPRKMAVRVLFWRVKRRIQILLEVKEDFPQSSIDHQVNLPLWFALQMAKAKQTVTDHFKVSTVIYSWNCRIPLPSLGADLANTKLLFPMSIYFSGRMCLPCSTADPIPASGTYPAGGGIVQTSRPCAPRGWKLPHGPQAGTARSGYKRNLR